MKVNGILETAAPESHSTRRSAEMTAFWRDAAAILAALVLGVVATLGYLTVSGGFYEYRVTDEQEYPRLINTGGWMVDREYRVKEGGPVYQMVLKRPRLHL
jgi:hypothetical protein